MKRSRNGLPPANAVIGPKTQACLEMALALHPYSGLPYDPANLNHPGDNAAWKQMYAAACQEYSEKAVCRKFEELSDRGYMEYGVSARTGWLTDRGRAVLELCRYQASLKQTA